MWSLRPTPGGVARYAPAVKSHRGARLHAVVRGLRLALRVQWLTSVMRLLACDRRCWACVGRAAVLLMTMLVLSIGFCVFDADDHGGIDDHPAFDLCLGMMTVSLPSVLGAGLPLTGLTAVYQMAPVLSLAPSVPAPPPKLLS